MADLTVSNDIDNFMQSGNKAAARAALGATATGQAAITAADAAALRDAAGGTGGVFPSESVSSIDTISGSSHDMTGRLRRIWAKLYSLSSARSRNFENEGGVYRIFVLGGSGSPEAHGVYARNGTENSKERFSYGDDFKAYWNGSEWQVINSALNEVLFTNPSTASELPTSGWVVGADGSAPVIEVEPYHNQAFRMAAIGDSVGQRPSNLIAEQLTTMFTEQRYDEPHGSVGVAQSSNGLHPAHVNADLGGSAILHTKSGGTPDYSLFYTGTYWELAAATNDTITLRNPFNDSGLIDADTIKIYYVRDAGLGTFDVELSTTSDSAGFATEESGISTANGTKTAGVLTINKAAGDYAVRIAAATGTVKIIGFDVWNSTKPQVLFYPTATSSLTPDTQFSLWDSNIRRVIMDEWPVDLITWNFADNTTSQSATAWNVLDDALSYSRRVPTVVMMDNVRDVISEQIRSYADSRDWYYFSMYDAWGKDMTFAKLEREGLANTFDKAHKSTELYSLAATQILRDIVPWTLMTSWIGPVGKTASYEDGNIWTLPLRDGFRWQDRSGSDQFRLGVDGEDNYVSGLSEAITAAETDAQTAQTLAEGAGLAESVFESTVADDANVNVDLTAAIGTGDFSWAGWVKFPADQSADIWVFSAGSAAVTAGNGGVDISMRTQNGRLQFNMRDFDGSDNDIINIFGQDLDDGLWHFLAITFDRDGNATIYIDGAVPASGTSTISLAESTSFNLDRTDYSFNCIGQSASVAQDSAFKRGSIVTSDLLTAGEIADLYADWYRKLAEVDNIIGAVDWNSGRGRTFYGAHGGICHVTAEPTTSGAIRKGTIAREATLDFPSIATEATDTLTITVPGAVVGEPVQLTPSRIGLVVLDGHVSAADTVTVTAVNSTGGAINPGSTSIRATVIK